MQTIKTWLRSIIERIAAQNNIRANIAQLLLLVPSIIAIISKVGMLEPTGLLVWTFIATGLALLGKQLLETKVFDVGAWLSIIYSLLLYASDSPTVATLWPKATIYLAATVQIFALVLATFSRQKPADSPPINLKDK